MSAISLHIRQCALMPVLESEHATCLNSTSGRAKRVQSDQDEQRAYSEGKMQSQPPCSASFSHTGELTLFALQLARTQKMTVVITLDAIVD
mmetsp:Transcript_63884/g.116627  ORF Transcript_63884/g.116627 Transcript_63884/m.116627 type:complete len:91 (+) Transcript_63884:224-496(+)